MRVEWMERKVVRVTVAKKQHKEKRHDKLKEKTLHDQFFLSAEKRQLLDLRGSFE